MHPVDVIISLCDGKNIMGLKQKIHLAVYFTCPFFFCLHTVHLQSALAFAMESGATARLPSGSVPASESFDTSAFIFS